MNKQKVLFVFLFFVFLQSCSDIDDCENDECTIAVSLAVINTIDNSSISDTYISVRNIHCSYVSFYSCDISEEKNEIEPAGKHVLQYKSPCDMELWIITNDIWNNSIVEIEETNNISMDTTCNNLLRLEGGNSYNLNVLITPVIRIEFRKSNLLPDSLTLIRIGEFNVESNDINNMPTVYPINSYEFTFAVEKEYSDGSTVIDSIKHDYFESTWPWTTIDY